MRTYFLVFSIIITLSHQRSINEFGNEEECLCNWRLLRHYEAKGCQATEVDSCGCPVKFYCPKANEIEENDKACHYKGIHYASGSVINTTNPCESCRCTKGAEARIVCSSIKCVNLHVPLETECHFLYEDAECCPSKIICDRYDSLEHHDKNEQLALTCEYEGKKYPLGARIFSSTDPCEICFCTKDWNKSNSSCYQEDCVLEKYKEKLMDGCVPIYAEDVCCPIEFYCAPDDVFLSENEQSEETNMETADSRCTFGNKYYHIGKSLSINQGSTCVTCTCLVPPDFTCLHKACPPNPNERNCLPYFTSDDCCPKYDCLLGVQPLSTAQGTTGRETEKEGDLVGFVYPKNQCSKIKCTEGTTCMLYAVTCSNGTCPPVPTCMQTNTSCPTPQCAEGCVVTEQDANRCPTCVCGKEIKERAAEMVRCRMPRCYGENCYLVGGEDGCPVCVCTQRCPILECRRGCNVISENEGSCPKCVCEDETVGCPTPVCEHEGCIIESPPGRCPTCICDRARPNPPAHGELEMEGSQPDRETVSFQYPQQQQQQDFDLPAGSPFDSQPSSDDYDEISMMRRRSPPAETKTYTKNAADAQQEAETKTEHKISIKNGSSIVNSLNTTLKKDDREP